MHYVFGVWCLVFGCLYYIFSLYYILFHVIILEQPPIFYYYAGVYTTDSSSPLSLAPHGPTPTHTNRKSQLMHNFNRPKNRFILLYDLKKVNVLIFFFMFFLQCLSSSSSSLLLLY